MRNLLLISIFFLISVMASQRVPNWEDYVPEEDVILFFKNNKIDNPTIEEIAIANTIYKINSDNNIHFNLKDPTFKESFKKEFKNIEKSCKDKIDIFFTPTKTMIDKYDITIFNEKIDHIKENGSGFFINYFNQYFLKEGNCYLIEVNLDFNNYENSKDNFKRVFKYRLKKDEFVANFERPYTINEFLGHIILSDKSPIIKRNLEEMKKLAINNRRVFLIVKPKMVFHKWQFQQNRYQKRFIKIDEVWRS